MVANPSCAGGTGGCPTGLSWYMPASSAWKSASNSSWRCSRSHTNSLARLIRLITSRSSREQATGGCHTPGRTLPPPTDPAGHPPSRGRRQPTRSGYPSGSLGRCGQGVGTREQHLRLRDKALRLLLVDCHVAERGLLKERPHAMGDRVAVGAELLERAGELGVACFVRRPHRGVVDLDDVEAEPPQRRVDLLVGRSQPLERCSVRPQ